MKFYIADTGVFLAKIKPPELCVTTPSVVAEVKDSSSSLFLELACSETINIEMPKEKLVEQIKKVAGESGDLEQLSQTDIDLLAKALEYKPFSIIITDDYRIQNVARILEIPVMPIQQQPIKHTYRWISVCTGCGRQQERGGLCPVCGSPLRRKRIREEG
jgi:UPF0271 protein